MNLTIRKMFFEAAVAAGKRKRETPEKYYVVLVIEEELKIASRIFENLERARTVPSRILYRIQNKIEDLKEKTNKIKKSIY